MGTTDDELFAMLLEQLGEAAEVAPEVDGGIVVPRVPHACAGVSGGPTLAP